MYLGVDELQKRIMEEGQRSRYSFYMGSTKVYCDLKEVQLWEDTKKNIIEFVAKCPNYQQVKVEHQKLGCLALRNVSGI